MEGEQKSNLEDSSPPHSTALQSTLASLTLELGDWQGHKGAGVKRLLELVTILKELQGATGLM